jgi:hypothetical protein
VCAAAVTAVLEELRRIDVETTTKALGAELFRLATALKSDGLITEVTGRGCFVGMGLRHHDERRLSSSEVLRVVSAIADHGVLVQPGPSSIELIPAYGFTSEELRTVDTAVRSGLARVQEAAA